MTIAKKVKTREPTLANINDLARFLASFCGKFVLETQDADDLQKETYLRMRSAVVARELLGMGDIPGLPGWNEVGVIDAYVRHEIVMEETQPIPTMQVAVLNMLTEYLQVAQMASDPRVLPEQWQAGINDTIRRWAFFFLGVPERAEEFDSDEEAAKSTAIKEQSGPECA